MENPVIRDEKDISDIYKRLDAQAARFGFIKSKLGDIGQHDALYLYRKSDKKISKNILITAGFHGEEPGGCWGIVRFFESNPDLDNIPINLSFIPVVNPTGIRSGKRRNAWGENPNSGFYHADTEKPSLEGKILLEHIDELLSMAASCFISLHEDCDFVSSYLFTFEESDRPGAFSKMLSDTLKKHFGLYQDGYLDGSGMIKDGVIFKECDGSFEDFLFHKGIPLTACTETAGKMPIASRAAANAEVINNAIQFLVRN